MPRTDSPRDAPAARVPRTLVIGIAGGIASGKSAVARGLAGEDAVVRADEIAHEVLNDPEVVELVRARFGEAVLGPDGRPDRAALAARVFADDGDAASGARAELEGWIHPRVRARILARLDELRAAEAPVCVLDVPLLFENDAQHGLVRECDVLVFVDTDAGERERRASRTRGWAPGEVARRESAQLPLAEKRRRAHHVLQNNGSLQQLEAAIDSLRRTLGLPSEPTD